MYETHHVYLQCYPNNHVTLVVAIKLLAMHSLHYRGSAAATAAAAFQFPLHMLSFNLSEFAQQLTQLHSQTGTEALWHIERRRSKKAGFFCIEVPTTRLRTHFPIRVQWVNLVPLVQLSKSSQTLRQ